MRFLQRKKSKNRSVHRSALRRRLVERLEPRWMLNGDPQFCRETPDLNEPGLANGDFAIADPSDPMYAWSVFGDGSVENEQAVLDEHAFFFKRLAALIPSPGTHLTRYHGVFANRSRFRRVSDCNAISA